MSQYSSKRDTNFCFPIPDVLENNRIKIVPFIPSEHVEEVFEASQDDRLWSYLPCGPFKTCTDFQNFWENRICARNAEILFVIFDKTTSSDNPKEAGSKTSSESGLVTAGLIGYVETSAIDLCTEIGLVVIFPAFQRTHVASNAVGLLMHHALNLPEKGGWGLRRVQWQANTMNVNSIKLAERMGFQREATLRWAKVLPTEKAIGSNGHPERRGDPRPGCPGRDSALLAVYWDDWENGLQEKVDQVMARTK
ncbi:acyl-CoA N-acyltransferase [Dendrothele bispora CBS 962.96]|uniref:Acyl-CoA N-acyltransferase n=1 Tax=Dendrothele bispora (strain CBS 962.96) TaxID=1314807 RepID=A0A4V4HE13_DENBC|nr:acyl-CoA N-acyltransferase [Dendrothele bispora CBS 962.96]